MGLARVLLTLSAQQMTAIVKAYVLRFTMGVFAVTGEKIDWNEFWNMIHNKLLAYKRLPKEKKEKNFKLVEGKGNEAGS